MGNKGHLCGRKVIKKTMILRKHKSAPSISSDTQLFSSSTVQVTESTNISSITDQDNAVIVIPECTLTDVNGVNHQVVYPLGQQSSGKKCTKP
jgi:hypothetical protein